jgi:hypothetical protein
MAESTAVPAGRVAAAGGGGLLGGPPALDLPDPPALRSRAAGAQLGEGAPPASAQQPRDPLLSAQ